MHYDVIVAGGGPAGATAAKYLAQSGKSVLLIQKDFSYKKPCGGGLRADAFKEFAIEKSSITHMVEQITIESKKHSIDFDISQTPLAIVDRVLFDQSLRDAAKSAGATLLEAKVLKVEPKSNSVVVTAKSDNQTHEYEAKYLIAADGVNSAIRHQLRGEHPDRVLTNYCDIESLQNTKCSFYFNSDFAKGAYGWNFPYKCGSDIGTVQSGGSHNALLKLLRYLEVKETPKRRGFYIPEWSNPVFYDRRVFYVGDSAGQVLPFTYEGIYYAMKSAKLLADVLAKGAQPGEYEKVWKTAFYKKFSTLQRLQRLFLRNEFMIDLMMRIIKKPLIKEKVLLLWMDRYSLNVGVGFYFRVLKRVFLR